MNRLFLIILICMFAITLVQGQETDRKTSIELSVSTNYTTVSNVNVDNKWGFGAAAHYVFFNDKLVNILSGLEYNRTSLFVDRMSESPYAYAKNLTCHFNNLSIPGVVRFNFSPSSLIFLEIGAFIDISIRTDIDATYYVDNQDDMGWVLVDGHRNTGVKNVNYGPSMGIGGAVPVGNSHLLLKIDYKVGIRDMNTYGNILYNRYIRFSAGIRI